MILGRKICKNGISPSMAVLKTQRRHFRYPYEESTEIQRTPRYLSRKYDNSMWLAIEHIVGKEKNIIESLMEEPKLNLVLRRITRRSKRKASPTNKAGKPINSYTGRNTPLAQRIADRKSKPLLPGQR